MGYFGVLGGIAGVFLLACLSPGPVWVVITSTSAAVSRRAGVLVGLGVAGATFTWASVAVLGVGVLAEVAWVGATVRCLGAGYLVWLGVRAVLGAGSVRRAGGAVRDGGVSGCSGWGAVRRGYVASLTNPKAAAFFGSIFVAMVPVGAPGWVNLGAVGVLAVVSAGWHCGLAVVFSMGAVRAGYRRGGAWVDRVFGVVMIGLGVRLGMDGVRVGWGGWGGGCSGGDVCAGVVGGVGR